MNSRWRHRAVVSAQGDLSTTTRKKSELLTADLDRSDLHHGHIGEATLAKETLGILEVLSLATGRWAFCWSLGARPALVPCFLSPAADGLDSHATQLPRIRGTTFAAGHRVRQVRVCVCVWTSRRTESFRQTLHGYTLFAAK